MSFENLPSYAELKAGDGPGPPGTAWGAFGDEDEVGTVNLLDANRVLAGVAEVQAGEVHSLNWDIALPSPHPYRQGPERTHLGEGGFSRDDVIAHFPLQFSSQWDGLRHIKLDEGFYNGFQADQVDDPASVTLGMQHWAERGIAGRGVLLDVARHQENIGVPIDQTTRFEIDGVLLDEVAEAQGTVIQHGDVLLIRTGWVGWYQGLDQAQREASFTTTSNQPGLRPVEESAAWLWDRHVAAVAVDNMAVESAPLRMGGVEDFLHFRLIPAFGLMIGELFWLDGLGAACAADGRWTFLFTSAPLNVRGGVGSPPNALAIR